MKDSVFKLIPPQEPSLRKYIKLYYIHIANKPNFQQSLTYYPNYTSTLNIYQNSKLSWTNYSRTHAYDVSQGFTKILVGKFNKSREIKMQGPLNKLSIVFHPLGLNSFVKAPLSSWIQEHFSFFEYYGNQLDALLPNLFAESNLEKKRDILDQFFLQQFTPFRETRLIQAVQQILQAEKAIKVQDLANSLKISRKTLLRLFQKHLAYSVEEYISVVKFRKALIHYQSQDGFAKFSEVAYDNHYYDQADFTRQFKMRSGLNPRQLFAELQTIRQGLYWQLSS